MIAQLQADLDAIVASILFDSISVMSPSDRKRSRGRNPKYSQEQILRILVLKEILHLSFRDVVRKLYLNDSYRELCLLKRDSIPSASTLSYRQSLGISTFSSKRPSCSARCPEGPLNSMRSIPRWSSFASTIGHIFKERLGGTKTKMPRGPKRQRTNGNTDTRLTCPAIPNRPWYWNIRLQPQRNTIQPISRTSSVFSETAGTSFATRLTIPKKSTT